MTRAQEVPVGILEIFDQNYKKTPKEWDVFKIFDQNGKKIPKEWDVLKKIDQNWWDIYTDHFYFIRQDAFAQAIVDWNTKKQTFAKQLAWEPSTLF